MSNPPCLLATSSHAGFVAVVGLQLKRRPATDFMESMQQDINSSMRGILIDWLVEVGISVCSSHPFLIYGHEPSSDVGLMPSAIPQVAEEYKLVPDTLYLTVSYIDRFLSTNLVNRQRLQLLGVSCMLIAA